MLIYIMLYLLTFWLGIQFIKHIESKTIRGLEDVDWICTALLSIVVGSWLVIWLVYIVVVNVIHPFLVADRVKKFWRLLLKERQWFWNSIPDDGQKGYGRGQ